MHTDVSVEKITNYMNVFKLFMKELLPNRDFIRKVNMLIKLRFSEKVPKFGQTPLGFVIYSVTSKPIGRFFQIFGALVFSDYVNFI